MSVSTSASAHVALVGADTALAFVVCTLPKPEKPPPVLPVAEMIGEALALGFKVVRIECRRLYNVLNGQENPPARDDIRDFINSYVRSGMIAALKAKEHGEVLAARVPAEEVVVGIAGNKIAKMIAKTAKAFVKTAVEVLRSVIQNKSVRGRLNPINWFAR